MQFLGSALAVSLKQCCGVTSFWCGERLRVKILTRSDSDFWLTNWKITEIRCFYSNFLKVQFRRVIIFWYPSSLHCEYDFGIYNPKSHDLHYGGQLTPPPKKNLFAICHSFAYLRQSFINVLTKTTNTSWRYLLYVRPFGKYTSPNLPTSWVGCTPRILYSM
jgi:hypothetical protein